jgi:flagellar hook-associated protein 2
MTIRVTGLNSGLDTDSIIKQLVSAYSVKKDNYVKAQTKLSWKQSAWKTLNSKIYSLYNDVGNLRFSGAYSLKSTSVSDPTKANVTADSSADSSAVNGTYSLAIDKIAKAGYLTGAQLADATTTSSTLADLGYSGGSGTISMTIGGKTTDIAVDSTTKISDFVSKLNDAGAKASYDTVNHRIYVAAGATGASQDFSLTGSTSDGVNALTKFGLNVSSSTNSDTYAAWAKYATNSSGDSYYTLDTNGNITYDTNGKAVTNGTYDVTKTQQAIQADLDAVSDSTNNATTGNTVKKAANETAGTKITADIQLISYANFYKNVQDKTASLTASQKKDILTLGSLSVSDLQKTYETDADGNLSYDADGKLIPATSSSAHSAKGADKLTAWETSAGLITTTTGADGKTTTDSTAAAAFITGINTVNAYEKDADNASNVSDVHSRYSAGTISNLTDSLTADITTQQGAIAANNTQIAANNAVIAKYSLLSNGETASKLTDRVSYAESITNDPSSLSYSVGATRVNGQDSVIYLNNAKYTSSSNNYSINGLSIEALAETTSSLSVVTRTDADGIYKKIKSFLTEYNTLINEMTSSYNAASTKGYEPLTSDEKSAMSNTEADAWEKKIKDGLFRRDDTLDGVMSTMENAMSTSYKVDGKSYSLANFGIATLGVMNANENQENAYHINGDPDDSASSTKKDGLKAAISSNPDTVVDFMKQLTTGLYNAMDKKMKSSSLNSAYTVYNDKEMSKEYSDYTTTISDWQQKVSDMEDSYYKKFAAMESALASLKSNASSLSSLMG